MEVDYKTCEMGISKYGLFNTEKEWERSVIREFKQQPRQQMQR